MSWGFTRYFLIVALFLIVVGKDLAHANDPVREAANRLAASIRKTGIQKVTVVPVIFLVDVRSQQLQGIASANFQNAASEKISVSVSPESLLIAEQMERYLGESSRGDFRLIPSVDLLERIGEEKESIDDLTPRGEKLAKLINPDGYLEGMIAGTVRRYFDIQDAGVDEMKELGAERKSIEWNLIDLSDRTIRDTPISEGEYVSLAEVVYRGLSAEYFRFENGKLKCLLEYRSRERNIVPLKPSDPEVLYSKDSIFDSRVHPIVNSNCPFKVQFEQNGKVLPTIHPVDFRGEAMPVALINLEPGEEPVIRVTNGSSRSVMVAVFVDGVNIRGKVRELPDENCKAWFLGPNATGVFGHWWTIRESTDIKKERFVIEDWSQTIAGKLGLSEKADASRGFTVIFFTEGWPNRQDLRFTDGTVWQYARLNDDQSGFLMEEYETVKAGAAPDALGVGAKLPQPGRLDFVKGVKVGTILASMHVSYCPKSDTKRMLDMELKSNFSKKYEGDYSIVEIPPSR